jgi:aspartate carbamoyltransferase catalytic subunit
MTAVGPRHLLAIEDLGREGILALLDRAEELQGKPLSRSIFAGVTLGLLFFQTSTRTRFGFHAAMTRLGGTAIELNETRYQAGMSRGESVSDTLRCISAYCDGVVLRHPSVVEFQEAAAVSSVPIINGGSGIEHHPTQTLIDLFAIRRRFGHLEGLRIGVVGDLIGSRSARSLVASLAYFPPAELRLMAPESRQLPCTFLEALSTGCVTKTESLNVAGLDAIYMAGFPEAAGPVEERSRYRLTKESARSLDTAAIVLSPLPRIDEIDPAVDHLPQAGYFAQSEQGLLVRIALLIDLFGDRKT